MGGASRWTSPLREQNPRGRRTAARITLAPLVAASQQIVGSNAEVVRHFHQSRHIRIMPAALIILVLASTDLTRCAKFSMPHPLTCSLISCIFANTKLNYDFGDDSS